MQNSSNAKYIWATAIALCLAWSVASGAARAEIVWLDDLDLTKAVCGWGTTQRNRSIEGNPLSIGGVKFERGVGTHAPGAIRVRLTEGTDRFTAMVGVDDDVGTTAPASVEFFVYGDDTLLWKSGLKKVGDKPRKVSLNLAGLHRHHPDIRALILVVKDGGDGDPYDHADWADAKFEVSGEGRPETIERIAVEPYILTPPPPAEPRVNGARVFGVRPGAPFLYTIAATGDRPMHFAARDLPKGLRLDRDTGRITGAVATPGEHRAILVAENAKGRAERKLRIVVGEQISLTPPMGWNSWNCWAGAVDDAKVRSSAKAMADSGLLDHGWTYINIDDTWQSSKRGGSFQSIQGNKKFSDMKKLSDYVHGLGLKIGIYSTPWVTSYAGFMGGSSQNANGAWDKKTDGVLGYGAAGWCHGKHSFAQNDAKQWAAWEIDYLKYDWSPNDAPHVEEMANALRASGRDMVYSLSNTAPFDQAATWARLSNAWRTTGDIVDTWASMSSIGFSQDRWAPFSGPGHWNDADMLVVGKVGWGPQIHPTRLTPDEQYTHISLWCLLSAPLLLGCDLADLDPFTLSLLTNDEVLEVNQDPLGRQATRVSQNGDTEVWAKKMEDGSTAVGLFNRGPVADKITINWQSLGLTGPQRARDLWRQKDLGVFDDQFTAQQVPSHGVLLLRLFPKGTD